MIRFDPTRQNISILVAGIAIGVFATLVLGALT